MLSRSSGGSEITGNEPHDEAQDSASGLGAGITIVVALVLGALLGYGIGMLVGHPLLPAFAGGAVGLVIGFYAVYLRFIKQ